MVPPTRRSLLHGATVLAATLAGCGELVDGSAGSTRTATRRAGPPADGPGSGSETNPDVLRLRVGGDRPPVWIADPDDDDGGRRTPRDGERFLDSTVVGPSRADRITVADGVDRGRVDSFLAATDFDHETVYLETILVGECFRLDLCHVAWQPTRVSTDYARHARPYDERCAVDGLVFEAWLVRIPDVLDADRVNSHASSVGSGTCEARRPGAEAGVEAEGGGGAGPAPPDGGSSTSTGPGTTGTGGER